MPQLPARSMACLFAVLFLAGGARAAPPSFVPSSLGATSGEVLLSLRAGLSSSTEGQRHAFGLIQLVVPFDRLFAPRALVAGDPDDDTAPPTEEGAPGEPPLQEPDVPAARPPEPPPVPVRVVSSNVARRTVRAAWRVAGFNQSRRRLDSLARRARSSALLPELRLRAGRSTDESLRLTPTEADPFRYTESGGTDVFFEGRLTWKLSRLVFASEELAVERLRRQRESEKQKLAKRVLATLFAWYRARDRVLDPGLLEEEKILAWIEVFEAEAILDVLTDGWFGEEVAAPDTQATDDDIPASRRPVPPPTPGSDARAAATPSGDAPQRLNGGHHAR